VQCNVFQCKHVIASSCFANQLDWVLSSRDRRLNFVCIQRSNSFIDYFGKNCKSQSSSHQSSKRIPMSSSNTLKVGIASKIDTEKPCLGDLWCHHRLFPQLKSALERAHVVGVAISRLKRHKFFLFAMNMDNQQRRKGLVSANPFAFAARERICRWRSCMETTECSSSLVSRIHFTSRIRPCSKITKLDHRTV
jgi:hypothetical protein